MAKRWMMGTVAAGIALAACGSAASQERVEPEGWMGRALLIERRDAQAGAKWEPFKAVDLKRAAEADRGADGGPSVAVWSEGRARRVEIECAGQSFAWEDLRPGASAQLEFGCAGKRYRAQVGSVVIAPAKAAPALAKAAPSDAAAGSSAVQMPPVAAALTVPFDPAAERSSKAEAGVVDPASGGHGQASRDDAGTAPSGVPKAQSALAPGLSGPLMGKGAEAGSELGSPPSEQGLVPKEPGEGPAAAAIDKDGAP